MFNDVSNPILKSSLIAYAEALGEQAAIAALQRLLRVPVTGVLDGVTHSTLWIHDPQLVSDALAEARERSIVDCGAAGTV